MSNELNPLTSLFAQPAQLTPEAVAEQAETAQVVSESEPSVVNLDRTGDRLLDDRSVAGQKAEAPALGSIQDLANINTDAVEALRGRADRYIRETEKFVLREAEGVADVCNALDSLLSGDDRLDFIDLGRARNYVQSLMVTLRVKPEFDSVLLDRDVRNIIAWATQNYEMQKSVIEMKAGAKAGSAVTSRIKAATKKPKSANKDLSGLGDIDFSTLFSPKSGG